MRAEVPCTLPASTPHAVVFTELHRFAVFALVLLAQMLAGRSATTCNALAAHAIVLAYLGTSTGLALVLLPTVLADGFASTFFAPVRQWYKDVHEILKMPQMGSHRVLAM